MTDMRDEDYESLLKFRTTLRRFASWSEQQARAAGLTPAQHQLLLAVRGHPIPAGPTIGEIAHYLVLRQHSAVELVNRAEDAGLVERHTDPADHRITHITLTLAGESRVRQLSALHLEELRRLAPLLSLPQAEQLSTQAPPASPPRPPEPAGRLRRPRALGRGGRRPGAG